MNNKINELSSNIIESKKNLIILSIFFIFFIAYFFTFEKGENTHLKFEIVSLILLFITSSIIIIYSQNKNLEIHKIAFIILLIFGLFCVFLNPVLFIPDEAEHYARSDLASIGDFEPKFYNGYGYNIPQSFYQLNYQFGNTFFDGTISSDKISNDITHYHSVFAHNPLFGYLISALGIYLAKMLDLSVIWSMWLGRLFNLIFYASICAYAIKKAPKYKIPLLIVSALPLALSEGSSVSIDAILNGLCILSIGMFIKIYESKTVENKDLALFFIPLLLSSMIKITNLAFLFLIFIIPRNKFKNKTQNYCKYLIFILIVIIGIVWCLKYSDPKYILSWRYIQYQFNGINATQQLNYMLSHKTNTLHLFEHLIERTYFLPVKFTQFYHLDWMSSSFILAPLYTIFFLFVCFLYPKEIKFKKRERIGVFLIICLFYFGTYLVQYLSWTNVGLSYFKGVNGRYFIPMLALLPMTLNISPIKKSRKIDMLMITFAIIFIIGFLIMVLSVYY